MRRIIHFRLFIQFVFCCFHLQAQNVDLKFDTVPVTIAHCFHQDSLGFIWIGTQEGLLRYDGYELKKYTYIPFDSTSPSSNWILDIEEDNRGNLWTATFGGGLSLFDQRKETFRRFPGSAETNKNDYISKLSVDRDGSVWFCGQKHSLTHLQFDHESRPHYTHYNLFPGDSSTMFSSRNSSFTMHRDKDGIIWIGMNTEGLVRFNPETGKMKQFKHEPGDPQSISKNNISSIYEDDYGHLWIGTGHPDISGTGDGLNMFDKKTETFRHFKRNEADPHSICSNTLSSVLIDHKGTMWIGSFTNYFSTVDLNELLTSDHPVFRHHRNLERSSILGFYEDRLGNVWIGAMGGKAYKYDRQQNPFAHFTRNENYPNSLSGSGVWIVYADSSNRIWFSSNGLDMYDPKTNSFKHYYYRPDDPSGLSENWVFGICEDSQKQIWAATRKSGIDILNPETGTFRHLRHIPNDSAALRCNTIEYILPRANGDIWIASHECGLQLYRKDNEKIYVYDPDPTTTEDYMITNLCEDKDGILWIGTSNRGLYTLHLNHYAAGDIRHFYSNPANPAGLTSNYVSDIIQPSVVDTSAIWIATGAGLNRLDRSSGEFTHFFEQDGLSANFVLKILEDNNGNIWCATTNGISEYIIGTGEIRSFSKGDGLPFTRFGTGRQCAAKGPDGRLYFAGGNGVLSFLPSEIKGNTRIPPVHLTHFKIFHKDVKLDTSIQYKRIITLPYDRNMFSFQFSALNFTNPEKNQYAYKMEGLIDDWINTGNERKVNFTNLDPGRYVFRVKGSNNHGVWNEEGTSIKVIILPPWWATWWFRSLIIFSLLASAYAMYRYRINRILEMERMRVQIASDLHDDIGASLTRIAVHSEVIRSSDDNELIRKSSGRIGTMSREIITTLSDVVWSIDARNDTVGDLMDRMHDFLETVFPPGYIKIDFQTRNLHHDQKIDQKLRQNIYLIFKEAVNNAARHSGATQVSIRLTNSSGVFHMEIADNGSGFDVSKTETGHHGLENMRMRAERIGGTLELQSEHGTRIILKTRSL